ncbi:hypothetical protein [uncultured Deinococcus sp.]|nr:hypothetical protein [uncultured Deinococcus sp.]
MADAPARAARDTGRMPDLPPVPTDPPLTDEEMRAASWCPRRA